MNQPDLRDSGGRLRRLIVALLVGAAAATFAYFICIAMAKPDMTDGYRPVARSTGPYGLVWYVTAFVGAVAFSVALVVQNRAAKKK